MTSGMRLLPLRSALLDGEVVVLPPDGTTSFQALQNALSGNTRPALSTTFSTCFIWRATT